MSEAFTVIAKLFVAVFPSPSLTCAVKLLVPAAVGVPVMPPSEPSPNPAASDPPVTDHVYGGAPPVAANCVEYATPVVPLASGDAVVIVSAAFTAIVKAFDAVFPPLSSTCAVKLVVAAVAGVPVIVPSEPSVNPAGSELLVTDHVYGGAPPVAASVAEYAIPTVPLASGDAVAIVRAAFTVIAKLCDAVFDALSRTCAVKLLAPAVVGAPVMAPLDAKVRPCGRDPPVTDHVYGGAPPDAASVAEYEAPTTPGASGETVVIASAAFTVKTKLCEAVYPALSRTCAVKLLAPAVVGVPVMAPLGAKVSPAGGDPPVTDHVYGGAPPDAASVAEYEAPTTPGASGEKVVIASAAFTVKTKLREAVYPALSRTCAVKLLAPAVVGVPVIAPLGAKVSPAGGDPPVTDHVYGGAPPDAANAAG